MNENLPLIITLSALGVYAIGFLVVTIRTWMNRIERKLDEVKRNRM